MSSEAQGEGQGDGQAEARPVAPHGGPEAHDLLARLATAMGVRRYLEIGLGSGAGFARMPCEHAIGVDPALRLPADIAADKTRVSLFRLTGTEFFHLMAPRRLLDGPLDLVVLGGGAQRFEAVLRDFLDAEALCARASIVALHNALPLSAAMIERDGASALARGAGTAFAGAWTGDVWKMIPLLRAHRPDLTLTLADARPYGLVFVTSLDPSSRALRRRYDAIVKTFRRQPNDAAALARLYADEPVLASGEVLQRLATHRFPQARPSLAARLFG